VFAHLENLCRVADEQRISELLHERVDRQESAGMVFLNCTKNTELTADGFTRTFVFTFAT
jgi:hypothetical protein